MKSSLLANICCSFELEPQTLSEGQLTQAREVAQNQEPTEASATVFNQQGAVGETRSGRGRNQMGQNGEPVQKLVEELQHKDHKTGPCISTTSS